MGCPHLELAPEFAEFAAKLRISGDAVTVLAAPPVSGSNAAA
jgi:hypothetical protein